MDLHSRRLNNVTIARQEQRVNGTATFRLLPFLVAIAFAFGASAQTVSIDATPSHVANTFSPVRAFGSTVDRIPMNMTDTFFRPDQIQQILEGRLGPGQLSAEYRVICSGVALESQRNLERPFGAKDISPAMRPQQTK